MAGSEQETAPAAQVAECDVATEIPALEAARPGILALVLVRTFGEPIGLLTQTLPAGGITSSDLARAIVRELEPQLRVRFEACGLTWNGELPTGGVEPPQTPYFLKAREQVLRDGPRMTVAVCTHDRPDELPVTLKSLFAQTYERLRILVVDNAPSDSRTQKLVSALAREQDIEYVAEPRPGLSWARNRAIEVADGEVIGWVDDDEQCDPWWACEIARGFVDVPGAEAVTGIVIPHELETPSQLWFEQYCGVRRQRGFERAVFSAQQQSPLYPLPPFGKGANMAFRRSALDRIGRFDCALGAGTVTRTGEDTAALSELLLTGGTIVYQPSAIVYHRHRRELGELHDLLVGHGRGLGAFYTSMLVHRPSCALELVRLSRQAMRDQLSPRGRRLQGLDPDFPRELLRANRLGLLQGPFTYPVARLHARRLRNATPG